MYSVNDEIMQISCNKIPTYCRGSRHAYWKTMESVFDLLAGETTKNTKVSRQGQCRRQQTVQAS